MLWLIPLLYWFTLKKSFFYTIVAPHWVRVVTHRMPWHTVWVFSCVFRYRVCSGSASPLAWSCPLVSPSEPATQPGSSSPPLWPSAAVSLSASPSVCPALFPFLPRALVPARLRAPSLSLFRARAVSLAGGDHSPSAACGRGWQVCTHTTHRHTGGEGERCNTQHEADINHTLVNLAQTFLPPTYICTHTLHLPQGK